MIIIPALAFLRYSPHTAAWRKKWGWEDEIISLEQDNPKKQGDDTPTLH